MHEHYTVQKTVVKRGFDPKTPSVKLKKIILYLKEKKKGLNRRTMIMVIQKEYSITTIPVHPILRFDEWFSEKH